MKNIKIRIKVKKGKNEGSILIIGVTIMAFLLVFAVPFLFQFPAENKAADKSSCYSAALSLAEAGVERAIWEMNHGDISSWKGNDKFRVLTISSIQAPEVNVIGDIEIMVEEPDVENPVVKSTGRVAYTDSLAEGKTARVYLERTARVELERSGYNWVCSFPQKQMPAFSVQGSTI